MAKNPNIEPYVRTANTLDEIGLSMQADNVESLMRVGMAMDSGQPLFRNTDEHRDYLEFLREAKKFVESEAVNERTAGEKEFVSGEMDRYIELWSFMIEENDKVRLAQRSLPFSLRLAASADRQLTPEQLSMLDQLAPIFRNIWLNGIREEFGKSDVVFANKELNSLGSSIIKSHEKAALENPGVSFRNFTGDMRKELARAKKMSEEPRSAEQVAQVQLSGLNHLQSPEVRQITELLVSKQLEPMMQGVNSPDARGRIATNAATLINWFLEPAPNNLSSIGAVEEKARMVGMPAEQALPDNFFDLPAGEPGTNGVRWFDESESSHLSKLSNPKYAISNIEATEQEVPAASNTEGKKPKEVIEPLVESPATAPGVQSVEPVSTKGKKGRGKTRTEAPIEVPVDAETPETEEPVLDAITQGPTTEDVGMEDTDVTPVSEDESTVEDREADPVKEYANGLIALIRNPGLKTPEELEYFNTLKMQLFSNNWKEARKAILILSHFSDSNPPPESLFESQSHVDSMSEEEQDEQGIDEETTNALLNYIVSGAGITPDNLTGTPAEEPQEPEEAHAPGTEASMPGHHGEVEYDAGTEREPNSNQREVDDTLPFPHYDWSNPNRPKLKKLIKWLAGMGLGAAAIWGIVAQLAPDGAAKAAIGNQQSGYSQPMREEPTVIAPQQPQYTPPVQQPRPPVEKPQVPQQESPKTWANEYDDFWDTRR